MHVCVDELEEMEDLQWAIAEGRRVCAGVIFVWPFDGARFLFPFSLFLGANTIQGDGLGLAFPARTLPYCPTPPQKQYPPTR